MNNVTGCDIKEDIQRVAVVLFNRNVIRNAISVGHVGEATLLTAALQRLAHVVVVADLNRCPVLLVCWS